VTTAFIAGYIQNRKAYNQSPERGKPCSRP
jgi:hypothetical protein